MSYVSEKFGIMLMDGEEVLFEAAPNGFVRYSLINGLITSVVVALLPVVLLLAEADASGVFGSSVVAMACISLVALIWLCSSIAQTKYRYWLTNRRVVLASGFLGFTVRSIPLERVSDVALSNSFSEMLARIQSVVVRDMTGEAQSGKWLFAVDNAPEVQRRILDEVQRVNAEKRAM